MIHFAAGAVAHSVVSSNSFHRGQFPQKKIVHCCAHVSSLTGILNKKLKKLKFFSFVCWKSLEVIFRLNSLEWVWLICYFNLFFLYVVWYFQFRCFKVFNKQKKYIIWKFSPPLNKSLGWLIIDGVSKNFLFFSSTSELYQNLPKKNKNTKNKLYSRCVSSYIPSRCRNKHKHGIEGWGIARKHSSLTHTLQ